MEPNTKILLVYVLVNIGLHASQISSYPQQQKLPHISEQYPRLLSRAYRHAWAWPSDLYSRYHLNRKPNPESESNLRAVDAMGSDMEALPLEIIQLPGEDEGNIHSGRAAAIPSGNDFIHFPKTDPNLPAASNSKRSVWVPSEFKACEKESMCEHPESYPEQAIMDNLLRQLGHKTFIIGDEEIVKMKTPVTTRMGPQVNTEETLCETTESVKYPRLARSANDKTWRFVINQGNFTQGVKVEMCKSPDKECKYTQNFPLGFKTYCRQKYAARKLLAIKENGETISDTFNMPSCCVCYVKTAITVAQRNYGPQTPKIDSLTSWIRSL